MELLQLRYFLTAAREENFSRTAEMYGVPPSDISQSSKRLERELGRELFEEFSQSGITDMEISQSAYDEFDYKKVCTLSKEYDVNLWSLHLPFFLF